MARAGDGVKIAYFAIGEGAPLVHMPPLPLSNVSLEWENRDCRELYKRLAAGRQLIRYDCRGAGLSQREVSDLSLEAQVRDLEAVAEDLHLEQFALLGFGHTGPAAIAFAARHPQRVTHLVLWCSYARAADYNRAPRVQPARSLISQNWELYTEMEGYRFTEFAGGDNASWYTRYLRESATPAYLADAFTAINQFDVSDLLPQVRAPTLVLHRKDLSVLTVDVAKELASRIPDARLALAEGSWIAHFLGDTESIIGAIDSFLGRAPAPQDVKPRSPDEDVCRLTPRESEVLRLLARGLTSGEISQELSLSVRTVGRHITNIYAKIGVSNRADATAYAIRNRLSR
jgi:pimeloyl-ACP methyl ester carboxylesterase/DNA-binding CsgD family transcriptional regulator